MRCSHINLSFETVLYSRDVPHRHHQLPPFFLGQLISLSRKCEDVEILFFDRKKKLILFRLSVFSLERAAAANSQTKKHKLRKNNEQLSLVVVIDEAGIRYSCCCCCPNIDTPIANANEKQFDYTHWNNEAMKSNKHWQQVYFCSFFVPIPMVASAIIVVWSRFAICECVIAAATCT